MIAQIPHDIWQLFDGTIAVAAVLVVLTLFLKHDRRRELQSAEHAAECQARLAEITQQLIALNERQVSLTSSLTQAAITAKDQKDDSESS